MFFENFVETYPTSKSDQLIRGASMNKFHLHLGQQNTRGHAQNPWATTLLVIALGLTSLASFDRG
jgi:hypothetical protein